MSGRGHAHAAVTVLNATATGIGCALAVAGGVEATWQWLAQPDAALQVDGAPDDKLVRAVRDHVGPGRAARVRVASTYPSARGLKTSSSAAAALVQAAYADAGASVRAAELVTHAVAVSRRAGVTLTGALDDQTACVSGGCQLTDNRTGTHLATIPLPPLHVAVWVPDASIPKARVAALDTASTADEVRGLAARVAGGGVEAVAHALTANGRAFHRLYAAAGLPVDDAPTRVALAAGALGAGLSGTGPAVAALFAAPAVLPPVPGGRWQWTRTVPAEAAP